MTLTAIDQLWVADITYIRLKAEFVYLAVILDSVSRKVVGWALKCDVTNGQDHDASGNVRKAPLR
jgi:transposase InsO family protein